MAGFGLNHWVTTCCPMPSDPISTHTHFEAKSELRVWAEDVDHRCQHLYIYANSKNGDFFLVGLPYLLIHWGVGAGVLYIYKK